MKYVKRPLEVEAIEVVGICGDKDDCQVLVNGGDASWLQEALERGVGEVGGIWVMHDRLCVGTLEGTMRCDAGDYIIKGVEGEIYPIKKTVFEKTYEPVN